MHQREPLVDLQLRLLLEKDCAREGRKLAEGFLSGIPFTLLVYDFGDCGFSAFFTSGLSLKMRIEAFEALLISWEQGRQRPFVIKGDVSAEEVGEFLRAAAESITLRAGVGYSLLIGLGDQTMYVATGRRADVSKLIKNELLVQWRTELATQKTEEEG